MADKITLEETVAAYFSALRKFDIDGILETLSDEIISHDPVHSPTPHKGKEGMRAFFEGAKGLFVDLDIHAQHVFVCGKQAAVYFTAVGEGHSGVKVEFDGIDVIEFDEDGKIASLRAFWYPEEDLLPLQGESS